ncbi:AraC family transcriptional regulator [Paraflavitalea soli]|uniref:AraC family transcriptional regulator n=1 Tax=Paraflavitalea soli TaxID=2315862 RepID=A0A3B7MRE9_9BACT|nr:AraC family transcriptional regulator [Paraflavitalea soli]AXY75889.1 AraC family transcriptional regulator [Paraflavitalea soli]
MPVKNYIHQIELTPPEQLDTLVENRRVFNLQNCEFNVFESYQQAYRVPLRFNDLVISSMVRGKKVVRIFDDPAFEYLPGETAIVPANEPMFIDFPEARFSDPTQCVALTVDSSYVDQILRYLNEYYNCDKYESNEWTLRFNQYHFTNDNEISGIINKLIRICSSGDKTKNIFADLSLKELFIRLMQSQRLTQATLESANSTNSNRMQYVLHYIQEHLLEKIAIDELSRKAYLSRNMFFKWFKEQFGITPLEYITRERIRLARQLLADKQNSVTSVSQQCGFTDVNYFIRAFKKAEGITPKNWQSTITD